MSPCFSRRRFFTQSAMTGAALTGAALMPGSMPAAAETKSGTIKPLKLGLMTYLLAHKWDIETIIANMTETKYEHVELRTTHAHGVEVSLSKQERQDVRERFEDAGIKISLASGFAYHSGDPGELRRNIEGTKEYTLLARDLGA